MRLLISFFILSLFFTDWESRVAFSFFFVVVRRSWVERSRSDFACFRESMRFRRSWIWSSHSYAMNFTSITPFFFSIPFFFYPALFPSLISTISPPFYYFTCTTLGLTYLKFLSISWVMLASPPKSECWFSLIIDKCSPNLVPLRSLEED